MTDIPDLASLLPLVSFMFIASITPGPNNLLVASAGAHAGFRATLPHLLGIGIGHALQVALCALGTGALLLALPGAEGLLRVASAGYLGWLALRLMRAPPPSAEAESDQGGPMSFIGAAAFQWVNPKAWMMALTTSGALLPALPDRGVAIALACLIVVAVNLPCVSVWAAFGAAMRHLLTEARHWQRFNLAMGGALVATAGWIVAG